MKLFRNMASSLICLGIVFMFGKFSVYAESLGEVNDNVVNIRSEASTGSKVLAQADAGFKVSILAKENEFYRIKAEGFDLAYISAQYVDLIAAEAEVSDNRVNLRKQPSTTSDVITILDAGIKLSITGINGDWYAVNYNGEKAFIHKDFIKGNFLSAVKTVNQADIEVSAPAPKLDVAMNMPAPAVEAPVEVFTEAVEVQAEVPVEQPKQVEGSDSIYAVINSNTGLKLRTGPSLDSDVLKILPYGEVLDVLVLDDTWTQVSFDGLTGYVSSEFITISRGQRPERIVVSKGQQVIDYARQFLGTPYVYGGNSLTKGVDCSGFVYQVMNNFGYKLNRNSSAQYKNGTPVKKADLQTGDLVFFNTTGGTGSTISHVGIYIGNGQFIHSSSSKRTWGITVSSLNEAYYQRTYVSACRVLN